MSLDETVFGWNCRGWNCQLFWMKRFWTKAFLDESVFGWKCFWTKVFLDESVFAYWMKVYLTKIKTLNWSTTCDTKIIAHGRVTLITSTFSFNFKNTDAATQHARNLLYELWIWCFHDLFSKIVKHLFIQNQTHHLRHSKNCAKNWSATCGIRTSRNCQNIFSEILSIQSQSHRFKRSLSKFSRQTSTFCSTVRFTKCREQRSCRITRESHLSPLSPQAHTQLQLCLAWGR